MNAGRAQRSHMPGPAAIELGVEPPLRVGNGDEGPPDPRAVSFRWLAGTVLTGMAGAGLLGGAIYSTLESETRGADAPRLLAMVARPDGERLSAVSRKGDRLTPEAESVSARQVIRVSAITRHGAREVVKMRPFVRVSASLARQPTDRASEVPPFDPLKVLADAPQARAATPADSDGDLSFVVSDLGGRRMDADEGPTVPPVDVRARVREAAAFEMASRFEPTTQLPPGAQSRLAYAAESMAAAIGTPFDGRAAANVTLVAKSAPAPDPGATGPGERSIQITADGALEAALVELAGAAPDDARAIARRFAGRDGYGLASVKAGQRLKVLMGRSAAPGLNRLQPVRASLFDAGGEHVGSVALSDQGDYVAIADMDDFAEEPSAEEIADEVARPGTPSRMRLYNGLYEAALRNQVPKAVIDEMVRIVSYDVDFNRPVGAGDSFEVFYGADDDLNGEGEVAYMALSLAGEQRRFFRYLTEDDGLADYYDETGKSAKKFLMRKPMNGGVMRSGFGFRRHPVLGYSKMHTGVDWSAPVGTPIVASGNGTVEKAGWANGYGRQVVLQHANGYETTYNHMSGIGRGVTPGARVRQGQVIGFVGSTGLSTGAHLHYEVLVNGRFVNPMKVKLPRGRELDGEMLAGFQRERERIEGLLGRGGSANAARAASVAQGG
ncbi:M23 family metallopeptidase [Methylopila henanensis]|uniref:M23 family metallopeptidase n=1 Tax=Methylopila henanensis TaxID=873516 RepID=A0ABW4K937_9HYPH